MGRGKKDKRVIKSNDMDIIDDLTGGDNLTGACKVFYPPRDNHLPFPIKLYHW